MIAVALVAASLGGLHGARYCEVFEVQGAPPVRATVWNTIGLNTCPQRAFDRLDPGALADERGATAVVLNPPRYFEMDSVRARRGRVERFGALRMRRVATIDLRGGDLVVTPYADRVIARDNTWRWKRGRTVTELVAPGGDVYVRQSTVRSGQAATVPPGWSVRTRRLRHPFVLSAGGAATILRDDQGDTYQLASATHQGAAATRAVDMTGATTTTFLATPGGVVDRGTVTGTPFGDGAIELTGTLAGGRLEGTYWLTFAGGAIRGRVDVPFTVTGSDVDFAGRTDFLGGTGAFRGITGTLDFTDHNKLDGQSGTLHVTGAARY